MASPNGNGHQDLVIADSPEQVVLGISFTVDFQVGETEVSFDPVGTAQRVSTTGLQMVFAQAGVDLVEGDYAFEMRFVGDDFGCQVVDLPETASEAEIVEHAEVLFGDGSELGKLFEGWYRNLWEAHRNFPRGEEGAVRLAEGLVTASLTAALSPSDPTRENIQLPAIEAIVGMRVEGACARCGFYQRPGFLEIFSGQKPEMHHGVINYGEVNMRVVDEDGSLVGLVGYLEHENPFEELFHVELAARVTSALQVIDVVALMRRFAAETEVQVRLNQRLATAFRTSYGFDSTEVATEADALEQKQREAQAERELQQAAGGMGDLDQLFSGTGLEIIAVGPDGVQSLDLNGLEA